MRIGYFLSCEEYTPRVLLEQARLAEQAGFEGSSVVCGPDDPGPHLAQTREYIDVGYDEIYVANMGPHYADMIQMWGSEVLPELR